MAPHKTSILDKKNENNKTNEKRLKYKNQQTSLFYIAKINP